MNHRWKSEDMGLIWCWEKGRQMRDSNPELAQKAENGELMTLGWKGGIPDDFKGKTKIGSLQYLAQWQGLANLDLNIDTNSKILLKCNKTEVEVEFSNF